MAQDTLILAARQQRTEKISGRFFTVISATAKFTVELDGRIRREVRAGSKITAEPFKRISFIETEGVANTIVFDAGNEQYEGEVQVSGVSNETFDYAYLMNVSGAKLNISAAGKTSLPLVIAINGVNYTRKSFHVSNPDADDLGIYAKSGALLDICLGNSERTFYFTQDVDLQGVVNGVGIALCYTLYNTTPQ